MRTFFWQLSLGIESITDSDSILKVALLKFWHVVDGIYMYACLVLAVSAHGLLGNS